MAKQKQGIQQYKIFTLHKGIKDAFDSAPIAIFDDMDILTAFIKASKGLITPHNSWVEHNSTELKPVPDNFNVTLNPDFYRAIFGRFFVSAEKKTKAIKPAKKTPSVASETDAGQEQKPEVAEALVGLKIGRKGGAGAQ